jgi:hypothetical protein
MTIENLPDSFAFDTLYRQCCRLASLCRLAVQLLLGSAHESPWQACDKCLKIMHL